MGHLPIGETAALAAAALWAGTSILWTRQMAVSWPQAMNLFKTALCFPLFLLVLLLFGPRPALAGVGAGSFAILFVSGVAGMSLGDSAYFAALGRIGATRTMLIQTLTPLFAAALSAAFGQPLPGRLAAVGVAFVVAGLALVLRERPHGTIVRGKVISGLAFALLAAFCQALGIVLTKLGLEEADVLQASTIRIFAGVLGVLLFSLLRGRLAATVSHAIRPPSLRRILPAALLGSFVGFFLFQVAVRYADPAITAALTGTSPLFVAPLSAVFLGETMKPAGWIGTILAVLGVALVMSG
ncbi:MAG: EamA family transporter [Candidatus Eisenbacteria bacterium]|nr:DMT family transporter [Candidatus Eisenbacteria bacterium]